MVFDFSNCKKRTNGSVNCFKIVQRVKITGLKGIVRIPGEYRQVIQPKSIFDLHTVDWFYFVFQFISRHSQLKSTTENSWISLCKQCRNNLFRLTKYSCRSPPGVWTGCKDKVVTLRTITNGRAQRLVL